MFEAKPSAARRSNAGTSHCPACGQTVAIETRRCPASSARSQTAMLMQLSAQSAANNSHARRDGALVRPTICARGEEETDGGFLERKHAPKLRAQLIHQEVNQREQADESAG